MPSGLQTPFPHCLLVLDSQQPGFLGPWGLSYLSYSLIVRFQSAFSGSSFQPLGQVLSPPEGDRASQIAFPLRQRQRQQDKSCPEPEYVPKVTVTHFASGSGMSSRLPGSAELWLSGAGFTDNASLMAWGHQDDLLYSAQCSKGMGSSREPCRAWLVAESISVHSCFPSAYRNI